MIENHTCAQPTGIPFLAADFTFETSRAFRSPPKDSEQYRQLLALFTDHTHGTLVSLSPDELDLVLADGPNDLVYRLIRLKGDFSLIRQVLLPYHPNWPETAMMLRVLASEHISLEPLSDLSEIVGRFSSCQRSVLFNGYDFDASLPHGQACVILLVSKEGSEEIQ